MYLVTLSTSILFNIEIRTIVGQFKQLRISSFSLSWTLSLKLNLDFLGRLYKFNGEMVEPIPIDVDTLLGSSLRSAVNYSCTFSELDQDP